MAIKPGEPVIIRKVANGYMIEPLGIPTCVPPLTQVMVFNEMGWASAPGDSSLQPCLLKFIEAHFGVTVSPKHED